MASVLWRMKFRFNRAALSTFLAGMMLAGSCSRKSPPPPPAPPKPPPPTPIVLPKAKPAKKKDATLPPAPPIATTKPPEQPPEAVGTSPQLKPPAPKKRPRPVRATKKGAAPAETKPVQEAKVVPDVKPPEPKAEQPVTAAPVPVEPPNGNAAQPPKLGQILSPEQNREYSKQLESTLERVKQSLVAIQAKLLTDEQKEIVTRVRTFVAQAEQTRDQDLVSAVKSAERADLLSRDLLDRLR